HLKAVDFVGQTLCMNLLEPRALGFIGRNDEFSAALVRHAMRRAKLVQHAVAARTMPRTPGSGRIIHSGVNDFAVAGRNPGADRRCRFRDDDLMTLEPRRARY